MKILHVSDTHTNFIQFPQNHNFDIIVHSGDMFPDSRYLYSNVFKHKEEQLKWFRANLQNYKKWIDNKPFLFVLGNHDFISDDIVEQMLKDVNINAISLHNKLFNTESIGLEPVNFYGFPYVPPINGKFAYETNSREMVDRVNELVSVAKSNYIDVIVSHAPIYNVLDRAFGGYKIGNVNLRQAFDYKLEQHELPIAVLFGHCHEDNGIVNYNNIICSNAATIYNLINI